jgi:hypothetical protein
LFFAATIKAAGHNVFRRSPGRRACPSLPNSPGDASFIWFAVLSADRDFQAARR